MSRYDSRAADPCSYRDRRSEGGFGGSSAETCSSSKREEEAAAAAELDGLPRFEKNFYVESPSVAAMTEQEVEAYRRKRDITVEVKDVPKPVKEFKDVGFPEEYLLTWEPGRKKAMRSPYSRTSGEARPDRRLVGPMSRRKRSLFVRTLLFLFGLNTVCIFLYFNLHPRPQPPLNEDNLTLTPPYLSSPSSSASSLKPWSHLPSYLPWNITTFPPVGSCEAYFGNGFSRSISPLKGRNGFFRCHYSETLQSSICEGGTIRMNPGRIAMSRGGEDLEKVMGRKEEDELPKYESGAFQIEEGEGWEKREDKKLVDHAFLDQYLKHGQVHMHTMRSLVESIQVVPTGTLHCDQVIDEPTLLVTRFEYANMFHTVTDWYSAYVSSRVTGLARRPHLVFVDGHCKAQLEETWKALFTSMRYAKDFTGTVCFRHAILSPVGYETALFKGLTEPFSCQGSAADKLLEKPDYQKTARLSEFGEMLLSAFDLLPVPKHRPSELNILFVRREDYLAHPRHSGKVESRLSNELEVFDAVNTWVKLHDNIKCKLNVVNGLFAHMHMKEQLKAIRDASIIIGAHGAGLTHLVSGQLGTIVLEIIASMYNRPHFKLISGWKGLEYHAINLPRSYARPDDVANEVSRIAMSLGC